MIFKMWCDEYPLYKENNNPCNIWFQHTSSQVSHRKVKQFTDYHFLNHQVYICNDNKSSEIFHSDKK